MGEDHIFSPTLLNSVRFGFNRANVPNYVAVAALNPLAADSTLGTSPGFDAAGLVIGGITPNFQGGLNTSGHITYTWNSFQGYDDASLTRGTHSLKFGFAVERMQLNAISTGGAGLLRSLPSPLSYRTSPRNSQHNCCRPPLDGAIAKPSLVATCRTTGDFEATLHSIWVCGMRWSRCQQRSAPNSYRCPPRQVQRLILGILFSQIRRCAISNRE